MWCFVGVLERNGERIVIMVIAALFEAFCELKFKSAARQASQQKCLEDIKTECGILYCDTLRQNKSVVLNNKDNVKRKCYDP